MRTINLIFLFVFLFVLSAYGQSSNTIISLRNISVSPSGIEHSASGIDKIADGNRINDNQIFHTRWGGIPKQPVIIEAELEGKDKRLDRVILYPRAVGYNGIIKNAEIWVQKKQSYQKIADVHAEMSNSAVYVDLTDPIENPEKIKIVIHDAYRQKNARRKENDNLYFVSLGELECFMLSDDAITGAKLAKDIAIFDDLTATQLKPDVNENTIAEMKIPALRDLATQLYNQTYNPGIKLADFGAYLHPDALGEKMRIGNGFNKYEGITGVVLNKGENILFVGNTHGADINLIIPDWTRKAPQGIKPEQDPAGWGLHHESFKLKEGVNVVRLEKGGLAYIQYFTDGSRDDYSPISVHFLSVEINGYFDTTRGDTNADFNALLEQAVSPIMDMRGKYIQVAFPVDSLKSLTWDKGVELLNSFDQIVALQRQFIGWDKEGFNPKNHVLARINYHYYMFRDQDGVAYINWAMPMVANPASIVKGDPCWGFSHELGHVLQMRPQITWGGMTEVSNNILTLYSTTKLGNRSRLSVEGRYAQARETILDKDISYMHFLGMQASDSQYGGDGNTDVFHRLVPFWQLHLYFTEQGYPDFYPDLMIAMRNQEPLGGGDKSKDYLNMLEFCRLACEVSQTDLTEFFERWGFFYVGKIEVNDYGTYRYNVLQEEVDAVKDAIKAMKLQKPKKDIALMED